MSRDRRNRFGQPPIFHAFSTLLFSEYKVDAMAFQTDVLRPVLILKKLSASVNKVGQL